MARITYTPEERRARLETAHAEMTAAVEAIVTGDQWRAFLSFAGKLHAYSAGNRMWLFQQAMLRGWDDLGHVAGYRTWQALGRQVAKGERGLQVLAPVGRKELDEETGQERYRVVGFKVEHVFADRQTTGDGSIPEPMRPQLLAGAGPEGALASVVALLEARGFQVQRAQLFPACGTTSFTTHVVTLSDRLEDAAALKTAVHELAHVHLHAPGQVDYHANRPRCEVEAESVAYLVCSALGMATDDYSWPYVATWGAGDLKVVTATAEVALRTAEAILSDLATVQAPELVGVA